MVSRVDSTHPKPTGHQPLNGSPHQQVGQKRHRTEDDRLVGGFKRHVLFYFILSCLILFSFIFHIGDDGKFDCSNMVQIQVAFNHQ